MKKTVLFICTHNSARSQMAEGLMNHLMSDAFEASSAGTQRTKVNAFAVKAMADAGIDISSHYSKSVEEFRGKNFDYVVTVCDSARESCPFFPGRNVIHRPFEDPSYVQGTYEEILDAFSTVRDRITEWLLRTFKGK